MANEMFTKKGEDEFNYRLPAPVIPESQNTNLWGGICSTLKKQNQMLKSLLKHLSELEEGVKSARSFKRERPESQPEANSDSLNLDEVYSKNYDFALKLATDMKNPLCKGKYFNLNVCLKSLKKMSFPTKEKLNIQINMYSSENPPKIITRNMLGQKIMKGHTKTQLEYDSKSKTHVASFKIQINEVTSHFIKGCVYLVVTALDKDSKILEMNGFKLRPLIVSNLVVKAKEMTCKRWREKAELCKKSTGLSVLFSESSQDESN